MASYGDYEWRILKKVIEVFRNRANDEFPREYWSDPELVTKERAGLNANQILDLAELRMVADSPKLLLALWDALREAPYGIKAVPVDHGTRWRVERVEMVDRPAPVKRRRRRRRR